jgi:hypothetical protein
MKFLILVLLLASIVIALPLDSGRRLAKKCVAGECLCNNIRKAFLEASKKNNMAYVLTTKVFAREIGKMEGKIRSETKRAAKRTEDWFAKVNTINKKVVDPKKCQKKKGKLGKDCTMLKAKVAKAAARIVKAAAKPLAKLKALSKKAVAAGKKAVSEVKKIAAPAKKVDAKTAPVPKSKAQAKTKTAARRRLQHTWAAGPVAAKPAAAGPVAAKPVAAGPVAAKPVAAGPVAAKPVAAKPVAAKPVAAKPVAAKPVAAKPVAAIVITGKLKPSYIGLHAKPDGVQSFIAHMIRHRKRWEGKVAKRQNLFAMQNTWGSERVRHFSGKCPRLDGLLMKKYARHTALLAKKHKTYIANMEKKFQKFLAEQLKGLKAKEVIKPKWVKGLKYHYSKIIAAELKKTTHIPKLVKEFKKLTAKK